MLQYTDSQVDRYMYELCMYLDSEHTQQLRSRLSGCLNVSDRTSAFMDFLCVLGSICFRYTTYYSLPSVRRGGGSSLVDGMYVFGGEVWERVDGVKLKIALKDFCIGKLGMSTQEWLRNGDKYMLSLRDGSMLSPLEVSKRVVGFGNGVYDFTDINNIVYHPFADRLPVIELLGYDYSLSATCPLWRSFLSTILDKNQVSILQKFFALGLFDRASMEHKVENTLWLVGPGGVGKSTILDTITAVYGRSNVSSASLNDLLSVNSVTRPLVMGTIAGKVFNFCGEAQVSTMTGAKADGFKSLCSGEAQPVRMIGKDYELRSDIPFMVFSMNKKPRLGTIDNAITRRILFVTFKTMIREADRDAELGHKLLGELSGIRNWLLEGYRMLIEDDFRFENSKGGVEETDSWMAENGQTLGLFLRKYDCRPYAYANSEESSHWYPVKILYDRYETFCNKWGYELDTELAGMGRELRRLGYTSKRTASGMSYQIYGGEKLV